jgi:hypothetical protein
MFQTRGPAAQRVTIGSAQRSSPSLAAPAEAAAAASVERAAERGHDLANFRVFAENGGSQSAWPDGTDERFRGQQAAGAGWPGGTIQLSAAKPKAVKREMFDQKHDFIVPEQTGWYQSHVKQRIAHCVTLNLKVWSYHLWAKQQATGAAMRRMASAISDKAEAQAGVGNYGATGGKLDAAHLMNTTVRHKVLSEGQNLTPEQTKALEELNLQSAATTMQLKTNNVGPDKVIDTCMTQFKTDCAALGDAGKPVPKGKDAVQALAKACLLALQSSDKAQEDNYKQAIAGVTAALDVSWDIDNEVEKWTLEYKFV